ncbi:MAG: serine acetyltransferase [Desulfobacteraceae bacterium]|nr:serine acetyltransferase [Desulfobacteraceae bacterium]MBC2754682.1 serine acetyltransferase [Desulfobacteraceae bacterium]
MDDQTEYNEMSCRTESFSYTKHRARLHAIVDRIIDECNDDKCNTHIDYEQLPSKTAVIEILHKLRAVLFPGYFNDEKIDPVNLRYYVGQTVAELFDMLSEQISSSIRHDCFKFNLECTECTERGYENALALLESIPELQRKLATDILAVSEGDPAAKSYDEIIFSYPGVFAVTVYRIAHLLYHLGVPLLPRMMSEYVHGETGIDIHPGAEIDERFVIDHGTGVVIGETAEIGKNVRIYQGVTIGALSVPKGKIEEMKGRKRHPTIEDEVIIYSGATILGGNTVIGARSVIGGNVWITESLPPDTQVLIESPHLIYRKKN